MKQNAGILTLFVLIILSCSSQKKTTDNAAAISSLIEQQRFTFMAHSVSPTEDARYNVRNMFPNGSNLYELSAGYDLRVTPDSVIAYLPFFGRSFTAPMNPNEGGIKFTSTHFSYKKHMRKGSHEIEIKPADNREISHVFLTITPAGYASLRVLSVNKSAIAYNGVVEANK